MKEIDIFWKNKKQLNFGKCKVLQIICMTGDMLNVGEIDWIDNFQDNYKMKKSLGGKEKNCCVKKNC